MCAPPRAGPERSSQLAREPFALRPLEEVIEAGIDDRPELHAEGAGAKGVGDPELQVSGKVRVEIECPRLRELDRGANEVDAEHFQALPRNPDGEVT